MNLRNIFVPAGVIGLVLVGYASAGWPGVAAVVGGLVMWALAAFHAAHERDEKAANRPMGYVGSAVMLNARLKPGVNLMHVMAMTQSLGERLSAENAQPEVYRWTDGTQSHVTCRICERPLAEVDAGTPAGRG